MNELNKIRNFYAADIIKIPYFIDTKSPSHRNIWRDLQSITRILSKLIDKHILTDKQILEHKENVDYFMFHIFESEGITDVLEVELSWYIISLIETYELKALDLELYEVCENLKRYKKIYIESNEEQNN
jgi:hypothetical protein